MDMFLWGAHSTPSTLYLVSNLGPCSSSSVLPTQWLSTLKEVWKFCHSRWRLRDTGSWGASFRLSPPRPLRQPHSPLRAAPRPSKAQLSPSRSDKKWLQVLAVNTPRMVPILPLPWVWRATVVETHRLPVSLRALPPPSCFIPRERSYFLSESRDVKENGSRGLEGGHTCVKTDKQKLNSASVSQVRFCAIWALRFLRADLGQCVWGPLLNAAHLRSWGADHESSQALPG